MKDLTYYTVHFEMLDWVNDEGMVKVQAYLPSSWNVERLNSGFWVDDDYEITDQHDNSYWVAPARIIGVRKRVAKGTIAVTIATKLGIWIKPEKESEEKSNAKTVK